MTVSIAPRDRTLQFGLLTGFFLCCSTTSNPCPVPTSPARISAKFTRTIPPSVDTIVTSRVGTQLVRTILHSEAARPLIEIQRTQVPAFKLLGTLAISSIELNGETLVFDNSSAVSFASVKTYQEKLHLIIEFYPLKGSPLLAFCTIQVLEHGFSPLVCTDVTPHQ